MTARLTLPCPTGRTNLFEASLEKFIEKPARTSLRCPMRAVWYNTDIRNLCVHIYSKRLLIKQPRFPASGLWSLRRNLGRPNGSRMIMSADSHRYSDVSA
jgi:hypothetical protein